MTTRRRKRHHPEQIMRKLRDAEAMHNASKGVAAVLQALEGQPVDIRSLAQPIWWYEGRGGQAAQKAGGRELPAETRRDRPSLGYPDAGAHYGGKLVNLSRRRAAVCGLHEMVAVSSEKRGRCWISCGTVSVTSLSRVITSPSWPARMRELARGRPRFGYQRVGKLLRDEAWSASDTRVYRLSAARASQ